jgi:hypothetical protein
VLLFLGLRPLYTARLPQAPLESLAFGLAACLAVTGGSFFWLRWAFTASHRAFQIAFLGGVTVRLLVFGALVGIAHAAPGLDGRGAALAIVAAFFPLTFLELYCLLRKGGVKPGGKPDGEGGSAGGPSQDG